MAINLEQLEKLETKKRTLWDEIRDFGIIFTIVFSFGWLFINAQLIVILFDNFFNTPVSANNIIVASPQTTISLKQEQTIVKSDEGDNFEKLKEKLLQEKLNKQLSKLYRARTDMVYKPSYNSYLKNKLTSYNIKFTTIAPDPRLIIPKIGVNVHIVNLTNIPIETIKKADYDKYLYSGVVKYPYTPDPGVTGNVFIFGHSSYYWWKHNPYGTVFAKIPDLRHGDLMIVQWKGKEYKYKIFKKLVLRPYEVDDVYKKYTNGQYLTIMACYPIGTDRQRMVILAKRVN